MAEETYKKALACMRPDIYVALTHALSNLCEVRAEIALSVSGMLSEKFSDPHSLSRTEK